MKTTLSTVGLAVAGAIALSACTTRETRIVQPAIVTPAPAGGTTIIVPERDPAIIVDTD